MLTEYTNKRLRTLSELAVEGKVINGLRKLLYQEDLWLLAYQNLLSNKGAATKGVNNVTLSDMSRERIARLIAAVRDGHYQPQPVRRVYIPKANGKLRPLGIPTGDDKLVQEVLRIVLERIYEPIFSDDSHGFRPGRSCHTAITRVGYWTGTKWFLELDVKGYFDNIDHEVLMRLLARKIDDWKFLRIIRQMLQAGYLENWEVQRTYSGTPQGGVVSPILANIYLHELDQFVREMQKEFNRGTRRRNSREATALSSRINRRRVKLDLLMKAGQKDDEEAKRLSVEIQQLADERRKYPGTDPFEPNYRKLTYCRYADDFVLGVIGSRAEAEALFRKVSSFLTEQLCLEVAGDKSGIRHKHEGIRFLGYDVNIRPGYLLKRHIECGRRVTKRLASENICFQVPPEKIRAFCQEHGYGDLSQTLIRHRPDLLNWSEVEIVQAYNSEFRGFANYYALAHDVKRKLNQLGYMASYSLFHTLAAKRRCPQSQVIASLRRGDRHILEYEVNGFPMQLPVWKLKDLQPRSHQFSNVDLSPIFGATPKRHEVMTRLLAGYCDVCQKGGLKVSVHMVHALRQRQLSNQTLLARIKATGPHARNLVLCAECLH